MSEFRDLMARLSDGMLDDTEFLRLNELLKADPIAQEEYCDHMLIDGLLEREFGGDPWLAENIAAPSLTEKLTENGGARGWRIRRLRKVRWRASAVMAAALLMVMGGLFWKPRADSPLVHPLHLTNAGFEHSLPLERGAVPSFAWYGDEVDIVERFSDVTPLEGNGMLRFVRSKVEPEDACELYQVVALQNLPDFVRNRSLSVEASAFFNGIVKELEGNDFTFGITVFAFAEEPAAHPHLWPMRWDHALTFSGAQELADADAASWQQVTTKMPLPIDTKYLLVQLTVNRTGTSEEQDEFPGHFADRVALSLVNLD